VWSGRALVCAGRCDVQLGRHARAGRAAWSRKLVITVETEAEAPGCPGCGVVATGHGRGKVTAADAPCFGVSVLIIWLKRVWRCAEPDCSTGTWSEMH
jgi:zinc-finger of transposase IS204/IS1001/IS1096/IS1165